MLRSNWPYGASCSGRLGVAVILATSILLWDVGCVAVAADAADVTVQRDVAVPMRDGVILRANVFQPAGPGPFPVLVVRTPYGKKNSGFAPLVQAGYIVVSQDARGRYASEGQFESLIRPQTHDAADGYDTVEWAARLPGSSGAVGVFGASYNAFLQWRLASLRPPSLKAMAAFSIPARYTDLEGPGTIRPGRRLQWHTTTISPDLRRRAGGSPPHTPAEARKLWESGQGQELLLFLPWFKLPRYVFEDEEPFMHAWLRQPHVDPWKLDADAAQTAVPNLNVCGWYDHCNGSIDLHTAIVERGYSETARRHSRLLVGPWSHNALGKRRQGEFDFGDQAAVDLNQLMVRWFDRWLKDKDTGVDREPPVQIFVMGANRWRDEQQWPLQGAEPLALYLTGDGPANTPTGAGRLVRQPPAKAGADHYDYDPARPVPSQYGTSAFTTVSDQRSLAQRQDILVYQTDPLTEPLEVTGYVEVELFAASSAPDTDFFARLIDVAPEGTARDVALGMVRARYRNGLDRPELITPGEVIRYTIRLGPTSNEFLPGHRIRMDITSSDFPNYDRNHNTAADPNADTTLEVARQTIRHGGATPSRLILPVVARP